MPRIFMSTLLTMVDALDPYAPGLSGDAAWAGPALTLAGLRPFTRVVLLAAPSEAARQADTGRLLAERHGLPVEYVGLPGGEPGAGLAFLRDWCRERRGRHPDEAWVACVNAGPPQARGWWWALALEAPGGWSLVEVSLPRYATDVPAQVRDVELPGAPARIRLAREPSVAYRVETDPEVYERSSRLGGRGGGASGSPPPTLDQALLEIGMRGGHPAFRRVVETAAAVAPHKVPVLLGGETGTGKGALARLIHRLSGRPGERWVALNCAALPETLAESSLFGHRKGAFTGAASDQVGKFELADRGTLFLDEVGELSLPVQAKLLKVLEDGVVEPLGTREGRVVDVRVIAATHRDLQAAVAARTFREDLFYRLSFARITVPALRDRRSDIPQLALHLLAKLNASLQTPRRLSSGALQRLEGHDWPGNIRDLENVIGRSLLLSTREELEADDLLLDGPAAAADPWTGLPAPHEGFSLESFLDQARRQLILRALQMTNGKQSAAARLLGLSPQAIHKFLRDEPA